MGRGWISYRTKIKVLPRIKDFAVGVYLQVHSDDFLLHPLHTPFFMGAPHFLQGEQPHV